MNITRLKAKNQVTIPKEIVKKLHINTDELLSVEIENNFIKLVPVEVQPRWTPEELKALDRIVEKEKGKGVRVKPGKEFSTYIDKITK